MAMEKFKDIDAYTEAAIANARYERIEDGKTVYAEIPGFSGVWASGLTREESAAELRQALQGWIDLQLERNQPLPEIQAIHPPQFHSLNGTPTIPFWKYPPDVGLESAGQLRYPRRREDWES